MPPRPRDDGLSEVVGFVLLLGVIVVALSLYQVYGVPAAGRENEIAHMNQVKDRFVDYKIALDSLWVNSVGDNMKGVLLSTAFDLGTGAPATGGTAFAFPILTPAGSGGTVSVQSGGASLTIDTGSTNVTIPLGNLIYRSSNRYWVDQTWIYQMGAVFLSQEGGTTVRVGPPLSIDKENDTVSVHITPVNITGSAYLAGSGPVRIETRLLNTEPYDNLTGNFPWVNISIEAGDKERARAWERVFREAVRRGDGIPPLWYKIGWSEETAYLNITGPSSNGEKTPDVILKHNRATYEVSITSAASLIE
ncbi:MAG: hypothetical protein GX216_01150 [Methanomicrobiales archaeon]|jgi:hypothetical protein|nr:hypothetical protein [Methanomicrobiales archaeon]